jgi:glycosyltransferase involved in cell wall biosynthesis
MKILFLFTAKYPYGKGDSFVENEMPFLAKVFDKIVVVSNECNDPQSKFIPQNTIVERIPYELSKSNTLLSVSGLFTRSFWKEMICVKKVYGLKINSIIIKTALITLRKSKVLAKQITSILKKHSRNNDSVYAYSYWSNDMAVTLAGMKKSFPYIKMISRAHGWDVYFEANLAQYLPFRRSIFDQLDMVYFISNKGLTYYANYFPELKNKMRISRLGVTRQSKIIPSSNRHLSTLTIVSCSHVLRIKRVHLIAEALAEINNFSINWIHFGDGALFDSLKNKSTVLLSHKENISYEFPGNVSNETVLDYFRNRHIDVLLNVSSTEGVPVSIMEAMSFGIPSIATNVGGTSEIVEDGKNGFLLSQNPSALEIANKIEELFRLDETGIGILRNNAFKTWEFKYDSDANYNDFINKII